MEAPLKIPTPHRRKKLNILGMIVQLSGAISYELFSTKILVHKRFSSVFGSKDAVAADVIWLNAHIGIGLYLYQQKFFANVSLPWRITYSVFGAAMFNFGSALFWGTTRALMPNMPEGLGLIFGLGSGMTLMYIGWSFFQDVNTAVVKKSTVSSESSMLVSVCDS